MNHKVRRMKRKGFLEKTWGWGFGSCQEACGEVQVWPASRRLLAICSGLKMAPEGSSASPPCPLFPQKARCTQSFMDIPPETPLIMGRKKGQDVTVFAGSLWSLMVVADGAECDVLERDIHILTQKGDKMLPSTASLHRKWSKSDILS